MDTPKTTKPENETSGAAGSENAEKPKLAVVPPGEKDLDFILDIPLKVSVELGRTKILVQDLLKLHKGSVVELSKLAGEPLEILVNERVVAKGEVIVLNEKFGVRLTDIVSHAQRIRQLGE
jgi:flagellar motor switch protein FliN